MKDLNISLLLDFYGNLLSDKQLRIMESYYQEDLSLSEIGELTAMTRQGVYDNIRRAGADLKQYENKLGLLSRFMEITEAADKIASILEHTSELDGNLRREIVSLLDVIKNEA